MAQFVHLHNHTEYSLLDGMLRISSTKPGSFLQTLAEQKVPAMAMTDHGNMYGAREFYKNTKAVGIKPIIGCEFYITPLKYTQIDKEVKNNHITILAKDMQGYRNLMELNSTAWVDGFYYKPRIDFDLLKEHKEGLIVLSGCLQGLLAQTALKKGEEEAIKLALKYRDTFGAENYYIEIMDHGIPEEQAALKVLLEVSKKTGIPLVATNDCHYEKREDWQAHDIHICIATGSTLDDKERFKMDTHELFFKSPEEMEKLFSFAPEALKNTLEVAEKCNLEFKEDGFVMPDFPIPAEFKNHAEYLRHCCVTGLKKKLKTDNIPEEYMQRLDYELKVITDMGFAVYFLIVADFIGFARSQDIPIGPGRGSGAGSLVAYSIDITRVDPLKNKLLFERFLNPDRVSMPDLDIDISDAGREEVINYMRRKYGVKNVASIITFGTMKAKLALKDTARVMGFEPAEANRLSKLIPEDPKATIAGAMETNPEIKSEISKNPKVKQLFNYATKIEGLKRHTGVHASGVLVTKEEVTKYTPLAKGSKDIITTQYEGNTVSDMGLLKIDFLGLRTLTVIDNAVKLVKKLRGIDIDIATIPTDDKKTFELLDKAETTCVFQLESGGMKDLVRRLHPSVFSDISALVALYRPGPMQSGMLDSFVKRKNGQEKITVEHKILEPVLQETYGTMIYQEQIMETAKRLSGFTPGQADTLRKAMGKKKIDIMEKFRTKFIDGAKENGCPEKISTKIFDQMAKFAEYGFNKSHSVAYALVAYQTAYLKANYPIEFMCSALTNEIGHNAIGSSDKENKIVTYLEEARKMGFEILPPDIQHSEEYFSVEKTKDGKEAIRIGLMAIKNLGDEVCKSIVKTRQEGGPFKDFLDVCLRIDLETANKRCFECLIKAGVFDSLYPDVPAQESRANLLANFERLVDKANTINKEKKEATFSLFGDEIINVVSTKEEELKTAAPLSKAILLNYEKEVLGLYLSGHPLAKYSRHLDKIVKMKIADIEKNAIRGHVEVAGIVSRLKKRQTKNKDNWAQMVIEDEEQSINCNIFSRAWATLNGKININDIVIVSGDIRGDELSAKPEIVVSSVQSLLSIIASKAKKLIIRLPAGLGQEKLFELKTLLSAAKGFCEVSFVFQEGTKETFIRIPERIMIHKALIDFLDENLPPNSWDFE
ncbi:MAG: DNA polymerase III subunit alpha [Elusimicrobiaceae bacterium]|nr:DNA polymerase III subunit alpha [Elusimicrobiaceae bacterium]